MPDNNHLALANKYYDFVRFILSVVSIFKCRCIPLKQSKHDKAPKQLHCQNKDLSHTSHTPQAHSAMLSAQHTLLARYAFHTRVLCTRGNGMIKCAHDDIETSSWYLRLKMWSIRRGLNIPVSIVSRVVYDSTFRVAKAEFVGILNILYVSFGLN